MYNELYHHGVKGQRWGIRRYQNKDGTLTPAGKKRAASKRDYSSEIKNMSNDELRKKVNRLQMESRYYDLTKKRSKFGDNADTVKGLADDASKANNISKASGKSGKYSNIAGQGLNAVSKSTEVAKKVQSKISEKKHAESTRIKLETMSDSELSSEIERLGLEQQYNTLRSNDVKRGKINVKEILSMTGDVLTVGASAVTIAIGIKKLKEGKYDDFVKGLETMAKKRSSF